MSRKIKVTQCDEYGYFTVNNEVDRVRSSNGVPIRVFSCTCVCGLIKEVRLGDLRSGKVRSCGCSRSLFSNVKDPPKYLTFNTRLPLTVFKNTAANYIIYHKNNPVYSGENSDVYKRIGKHRTSLSKSMKFCAKSSKKILEKYNSEDFMVKVFNIGCELDLRLDLEYLIHKECNKLYSNPGTFLKEERKDLKILNPDGEVIIGSAKDFSEISKIPLSTIWNILINPDRTSYTGWRSIHSKSKPHVLMNIETQCIFNVWSSDKFADNHGLGKTSMFQLVSGYKRDNIFKGWKLISTGSFNNNNNRRL